jgi:hypothetical protein
MIGGSAIWVAALVAQDSLTALGVRPNEAKVALFEVLSGGRLSQEAARSVFLKATTAEARVALVNGALAWAKEYTASPEFEKRYATTRKVSEPRVPGGRTWSPEEELNRRQAFFEQRIATEKKKLEAPPSPRQTPEQQADARKRSEDLIKRTETELARYTDPVTRADLRKPYEAEDQWYKEEHAKWEEAYPAEFRASIAKRLRDFLTLSATVDFGATLVPCKSPRRQHLSCFADPNYENKSADWKRCYRAGKPAIEAARTFAKNWLSELERK